MCLLIWTVFSGEWCGPWASCYILSFCVWQVLLLLYLCERYFSPFFCDRCYIHLHDCVNGVRVFLSITGATFIFPVWQVLLSFYLCGRLYCRFVCDRCVRKQTWLFTSWRTGLSTVSLPCLWPQWNSSGSLMSHCSKRLILYSTCTYSTTLWKITGSEEGLKRSSEVESMVSTFI